MRRIFLFIFFMSVFYTVHSRQIININRNWQFSLNQDISLQSRTTVDVPHTWNYDAVAVRNEYYRGVANYIKDIRIPSDWRGKRVFIRFYGVNSEAHLIVNGHFAGEHKGGYTAFTFEITDYLRYGSSNSLWVRVNNSHQLDVMPINGDFNVYGGIYRDVELIVTEDIGISLLDHGSNGVYVSQSEVTSEYAKIDTEIHISSSASKLTNITISVEIVEPETNSVVASKDARIKVEGSEILNLSLSVDNPKLWNGYRDAYLYDLKVKIKSVDIVKDSLVVPVGLRNYTVTSDKGFFLNGNPYKLHGVLYHGDISGRGTAMTKADIEADFDMMLEMGVNAIRMANYPQDPYLFELCDRYGILVWCEIPLVGQDIRSYNGFIDSPVFKENCKLQLTEMVKQNHNHSSVVFWGIFSNLITRDDRLIPFVRELNRLAKTLDPTRLTSASSNQDGDINFITDVIGWSQYLGWKEGAVADMEKWLDQLTTQWFMLKSGIGEYGSGGSVTHVNDTLRRPYTRERLNPER